MTRSRIVLETSDQQKSAILEAADLQGESVTDWFEEQLDVAMPRRSDRTPKVREVVNPSDLQDPESAIASLEALDWSFTHDDTRYLTHDLHPYPAKFIPQIPAHLIARLSVRGDVICDPFGGSATTAIEAVRLGRRAVSLDANPLSELIGRVKTGYMTAGVRADLEQLIAAVQGHVTSAEAKQPDWSHDLRTRYQCYVPEIPHLKKWFEPCVVGELALLKHLIERTTEGLAQDAALLAFSRIIVRVSNQDSETRYVSVSKTIRPTLTLTAFRDSLRTVTGRLKVAAIDLQCTDARFLTGDARTSLPPIVGDNTVDLIVTSPPYPNATDYHLYHRFRLFWLGFDPRDLGHIEIGSHLRHQRNGTGFDEFCADMAEVLDGCFRILLPGRYAVFVVGDALFKGEHCSTADALCEAAGTAGFSICGTIRRQIHNTRRSFAKPARRARDERLVVLRKPDQTAKVVLNPPAYRMWTHETVLRDREIEVLTGHQRKMGAGTDPVVLHLDQSAVWAVRRLTFTKDYVVGSAEVAGTPAARSQSTWQAALENGAIAAAGVYAKRKDPKYVTHGLHPFKGKFYPQIAKSLLNISGAGLGQRVLDPFCGSGTTLLEGMLNGFESYGCDLNPLAAKIARSKTTILTIPREVADHAMRALSDRVAHRTTSVPTCLEQFRQDTHDELSRWFAEPVLYKLNWVLEQIRLFGNETLVEFFEVILSSIIRDVSHQEPADLRVRRRKEPLDDAPVLDLFGERVRKAHERLRKYWGIAGRQPGHLIPATVQRGDSRTPESMEALGIMSDSVECVVTSPPYATALPYIDTDRLSLLALMGHQSGVRSRLERDLTGSREIRRAARETAETALCSQSAFDTLPRRVVQALRRIHRANRRYDVGCRRENMAALLWRYFVDMRKHLVQAHRVLAPGRKAFYVVGNGRTRAGGTVGGYRHLPPPHGNRHHGGTTPRRVDRHQRDDREPDTYSTRHHQKQHPGLRETQLDPAEPTRSLTAAWHALVATGQPSSIVGTVGAINGDLVIGVFDFRMFQDHDRIIGERRQPAARRSCEARASFHSRQC